ncbi:MAG: hypothetical protein SH817_08650 [Leptospira sp.]|nr:hypothetical protein [Leptospira sp.]
MENLTFWSLIHKHWESVIFIVIPLCFILLGVLLSILLWIIRVYRISVALSGFKISPSKHDPKYLVRMSKQDQFIYSTLGKLNQFYNANVSAIFQFHNGGEFKNQNSILKWTLTHDNPEPGNVSFHLKEIKWTNVLVSQANEWIGVTLLKKLWFCDFDSLPENSNWRRYFVSADLRSGLFYLVEGEYGPEFVLAVFWDSISDTEHTMNSIKEYGDAIASLLRDVKFLTEENE